MLLCAVSLLGGCAASGQMRPRVAQDPLEPVNRKIYRFNEALDHAVARPVARSYVRFVPHPVRVGVSNFFRNLQTPTVLVNDVLQLKFRAAAQDLGRFVLNSTVGVAGVLDPATSAGLDLNDEDFGQTLGHYGVHAGPFLELPILGPSDLRDVVGRAVDTYVNPRQYIKNQWIKYGLYLPDFVDRRAAVLPLDETLQRVFDPYAFIRDAYLQRRAYLVSDGAVPDEAYPDPDGK